MVEHCVSSAKGCGFNSQGTHILIKKMYSLNALYSKSLWIKASAKCINVNVNVKRRPPISMNLVYKDLCAVRRSGSTCQTPFWILAFNCTVALNCQNTSQNACYACEKCRKSNMICFFFLRRTKVSEAAGPSSGLSPRSDRGRPSHRGPASAKDGPERQYVNVIDRT